MAEWWTYSLSDFLLFSPPIYYRLIERHNVAVWPGHIAAMILGLVVLRLLQKPGTWQGRVVASILAAGWLWIGWAYLFTRYATINWAAVYFAAAFAIEAVLLLVFGVIGVTLSSMKPRWSGVALFVFALAIQPLLGLLAGRPWSQMEIFGILPDPTVVATLAIVGISAHWTKWLLLVIPVGWCLVSGGTEWAMASPTAWVMPLAMVAALVLAIRNSQPDALRAA